MKKERDESKTLSIVLFVFVVFINAFPVFGQSSAILGDVNNDGSVTIVDALLVAQYYVGMQPANFNVVVADANASGSVDIVDALVIAQYYVGIITSLPPGTTPSPASTPTTTPVTPTTVPTVDPTPAPGDGPLANPFAGAKMYVNPEWSAQAAAGGGSAVANFSTAIWFDSIASITAPYLGGMGLRGHMDAALSQGANLITIVLYDLPNRNCQDLVSNGDIAPGADAITRYKTEFIDPIAAILGDPKYVGIRIVAIIEPDSWVNLITNLSYARCAEVNSSGTYTIGIQYAINKLHAFRNVYQYVDIAYSAWLGWDANMIPGADYITNVVKGTTSGVMSISGFVSNIAQYIPVEEPFLPDTSLLVGGNLVKSATFCDWNPYIDELDWAQAMYKLFVDRGFPSTIGMLIDTSRNGWGGPNRPTKVSTSADVNTYVNESRIDRRSHRGNWCNQSAGIGVRPQANPAPNIHAFIWVKAPGISDGVSSASVDPLNPNLTFDKMCDPNGINIYCNCATTGAMSGAPHLGRWFQAQFDVLLANAYPPLN